MAFTYFFRDFQTLDLVVDYLVPEVTGRSEIKIWDAGCASGQEPYTFAIMLAEKMNRYALNNVKFYLTDIDLSNLFADIIEKAIYPAEELQRIPKDLFEKYFEKVEDGKYYQVVWNLRKKMIFSRESLLTYKPVTTDVSLIICKNVLLHQQPEQRVEIIKMFHQALLPGGLLAMEQTQKMPHELEGLFEPLVANAQLYKKK